MITVATGLPANTAKEAPLLKLRRWVIRPEDAHGGCHSRRRNEKRSTSSILPTSSWSRSGLPRLEQQYPQGVRTELSSGAGCGLAACQQRAETLHSRPGVKQTCGAYAEIGIIASMPTPELCRL